MIWANIVPVEAKGPEEMSDAWFSNGTEVIERWNDVFDVLAAAPRRQIVVSLLDNTASEPAPLPESAINPAVPADPEDLRAQLRHIHLPKLANPGFIGWETEPLRAVRGPRFEEVAIVHEALYAKANDVPDSLVKGCRGLEETRQRNFDL